MIQEKLKFAEKFDYYFKYIFSQIKLKNENIQNENHMNKIKEIIFDFVMDKIYDKIFPLELNRKDNKIYQNSIRLSWVKPCHFLGNKKQYVFGSFLNDFNYYFKLLLSEKSTRKKLINLDKIIDNISFFYKFNDNNDIGVDNIISILTFAIIKEHPLCVDSNIKYMKIYSKLGNFFKEGNKFEEFEGAAEIIANIKYSYLKGITEKEFKENINRESRVVI